MSKTDWALSGVLASAAGAWLLLCAGCAYQGGGDLPGVAASEAALAAVRAGDTTIKFGPCSTSTANCTVVATTCTVDSTTTMCSTTGPPSRRQSLYPDKRDWCPSRDLQGDKRRHTVLRIPH